ILKSKINQGQADLGYFIRDKAGNEVDYVEEKGGTLSLTEIKASKTFNSEYLRGIEYWNKLAPSNNSNFLVYTGDSERMINGTKTVRWDKLDAITHID
ncbi:MAG: hypothetical protein ACD_22C00069G0001, partial [uncultured bacterium]